MVGTAQISSSKNSSQEVQDVFFMACKFLIFNTNLFFTEGSKQAGWKGEKGNRAKQDLHISLFTSHSMLCLLISQWYSDSEKCLRETEARIQLQNVYQLLIKKKKNHK